MPRDPLQQRLEAMSDWRQRPLDDALIADLRSALRDKSSFIVARAAQLTADRGASQLADELVAAFKRLAPRGSAGDKGCRAKQAIVEALVQFDHDAGAVYRLAAGIVQMEPVFGGQVDTAADLRAAAAMGIANGGGDDVLLRLSTLLADREHQARAGAARALAVTHPPHAAMALLHLRLLCGESHPEVLAAGFEAMLTQDAAAALPLLTAALEGDDPDRGDAAALALGQSRRPEAWPALRDAMEHTLDSDRRRTLWLALAMLRHDDATAKVLAALAEGATPDATAAAEALAIHQHDPSLRQRAAEALQQRGRVEAVVAEAARWVQL
jgi:HEAT repeat protein